MNAFVMPLEVSNNVKTTIDNQISKVRHLQNENTISFLFFTDPHISSTSTFTDISILNYISNNLENQFTACCGDNFDNVDSKQQHLELAAKYMECVDVKNFFTVKGNHDDNSIQSEGIDNIRHTMLPDEQYDIMFKHLEDKVVFDESNNHGLYYYYDIPERMVRTIFLNSIDIPYIVDPLSPNAWKYSGQSTYAYSDVQLNWLAHTALKLPTNEWSVIFYTHVNPFLEGMIGADNLAHNSSALLGIMNAFKNGTSYSSSSPMEDFSYNVQVDFSSKGNIIAFFYGHTHTEQVLCKDGIKYISTWNNCPRKSNSNLNAPTRTIGTLSEFCINVVTLDLKQYKIYMTKFGAGEDLETGYVC